MLDAQIIHQELARLENKNKAQTTSEKELYKKMLGTDKQPFIKKKKGKVAYVVTIILLT